MIVSQPSHSAASPEPAISAVVNPGAVKPQPLPHPDLGNDIAVTGDISLSHDADNNTGFPDSGNFINHKLPFTQPQVSVLVHKYPHDGSNQNNQLFLQNGGCFREQGAETTSSGHHTGHAAAGIQGAVCAGCEADGRGNGADIGGLVEWDHSHGAGADCESNDVSGGTGSARAEVADLLARAVAHTDFYADVTRHCDVPALVWGAAQQAYEQWAGATGGNEYALVSDVLSAGDYRDLIHGLAALAFERMDQIEDPFMERDLSLIRMDMRRELDRELQS